MNLTDISIPTAALAIDGVTPEVGDEVEVTVRGTVAEAAGVADPSISDALVGASSGMTLITPTEANGVPFPAAPAVPEEPPSELSEADLREAAKAYDDDEGSPFPM